MTFKTNKYNLPLLNLVGSDGNNLDHTIHLGVAMITGQDELSFLWVMEELRAEFDAEQLEIQIFINDNETACVNAVGRAFETPRINLCRWHMNKDVLTYCRTSLSSEYSQLRDGNTWTDSPATEALMQLYHDLLSSKTAEQYEDQLLKLRETSQKLHNYLLRYWLNLHKKKLVDYIVNQNPHFNLIATSKVEGVHRAIKAWLGSSRADLLTLFQRLHVHYDELTTYIEGTNIRLNRSILNDCRLSIYSYVVNQITSYALKQTAKQLAAAWLLNSTEGNATQPSCTGVSTSSTGQPCKHKLQQLLDTGIDLRVTDFHQHWWIDRSQAVTLPVCIRPLEPRPKPKQMM